MESSLVDDMASSADGPDDNGHSGGGYRGSFRSRGRGDRGAPRGTFRGRSGGFRGRGAGGDRGSGGGFRGGSSNFRGGSSGFRGSSRGIDRGGRGNFRSRGGSGGFRGGRGGFEGGRGSFSSRGGKFEERGGRGSYSSRSRGSYAPRGDYDSGYKRGISRGSYGGGPPIKRLRMDDGGYSRPSYGSSYDSYGGNGYSGGSGYSNGAYDYKSSSNYGGHYE